MDVFILGTLFKPVIDIYAFFSFPPLEFPYQYMTQPSCHPYTSMVEPYPALETYMYVAALSGGPVGPSDQIGTENKTLIMATW